MKVSVSSYSFAQYTRDGRMTLYDCVVKAKEMGFDAIEFAGMKGANFEEQKENAKKIKEYADKVGIEISAYTIGASLYSESAEKMEQEVERLKQQLEIAKILGAKIMRHDVCSRLGKTGASRSFDLMLPYIAESARKVATYAEELGIVTCSENHGFFAQDSDRVERLFNAVNHDNFGILIDVGNFMCVDENPATAVSRLAWYAVYVHIKDIILRNEASESCRIATRGGNYLGVATIGEGDVPVKQCLRILKQAGYDGYLSVEYEGDEDCISGIERGKKNLQKMLREIEGV